MEVESTNPMHSPPQPLSRDEHPWPIDRVPSRLDAEQAHKPLDPAFVLSFKHAISNQATRDVDYLNDTTESLINVASQEIDVHYPIMSGLPAPELTQQIDPLRLLRVFRDDVYPNMSLLCHVPRDAFHATSLSGYFGYAMGTLGSMLDPSLSSTTNSLWLFANSLIAVSLEVDNREARNLDLINAWILLGTYGALCSDTNVWQHTNTNHGYVGTAARRLYNNANTELNCAVAPALLLADVLRSIHYGHLPIISLLDSLPCYDSVTSLAIKAYTAIMKNGSQLPEVSQNGSLTALVALLADIHVFAHTLHPLGQETVSAGNPGKSGLLSDVLNYHSPFIPFSVSNEARLARRRLSKALGLWASAYLSSSPRNTVALYYFCKMYLALPSLQALPRLAKYPPRVFFDGVEPQRQPSPVDDELKHAPEAETYAWEILEHAEKGTTVTASWLPITIFYASLVVWRMLKLKPESAGRSSSKVLLLFKEELNSMCWPCCETMASTLEALLS